MNNAVTFTINTTRLDEDYRPAEQTRLTTNFANLARGPRRRDNLRDTFTMINERFNALAHWDNPDAGRYSVELDIISVDMKVGSESAAFPIIETLHTTIVDHQADKRYSGIMGNNFSSYVRDYDFSVVLARHNQHRANFSTPADFGELHGHMFRQFVESEVYSAQFNKPPVICLSVSENKTYQQTDNYHPVLGCEFVPDASSLTETYFGKMGLAVRYFMPSGSVAPLAFYYFGDLLNDYSNLELISTVSTMETFQKIYRPEIYNANATAGKCYRPRLNNPNHSVTRIEYDRKERTQLATAQGRLAEEHLIRPYQAQLAGWSAASSY